MATFEQLMSKLSIREVRDYRNALHRGESVVKYKEIDDQLTLPSTEGKIRLIDAYLGDLLSGKIRITR